MVFIAEVDLGFFDDAVNATREKYQRSIQDWDQDQAFDQVAAWLLLRGMGHHRAKEVLAACNIAASE